MRAIFLSDAHLKGPGDAAHSKLIRFLGRLRGRGDCGRSIPADALVVDHLVIAGDFFDFWFGRGDTVYPGFQPVIDRMAVLKQQGVRICLCEGNHDFFLGEYFTGRLGIEVYPEWAEFEIDGLRVLVSHGDTVDRGNRKYLALRKFLRSRYARVFQRRLPLKLLWRLARFSSEMSKEMSGESQDRLAEVMRRFALGKFQEGYDAVILGHCHKPILHEAIYDGRPKTFVTLGDWNTGDSYLACNDGRFSLNRFLPETKSAAD
jgi:UDP-2,3-diacylglucosamine hydrolase